MQKKFIRITLILLLTVLIMGCSKVMAYIGPGSLVTSRRGYYCVTPGGSLGTSAAYLTRITGSSNVTNSGIYGNHKDELGYIAERTGWGNGNRGQRELVLWDILNLRSTSKYKSSVEEVEWYKKKYLKAFKNYSGPKIDTSKMNTEIIEENGEEYKIISGVAIQYLSAKSNKLDPPTVHAELTALKVYDANRKSNNE